MPPLVVPNTYQVSIIGTTGDGPFANVLHIGDEGSGDQFATASAVLESYINNLLPVMCSTVTVLRAYTIDLSSSSGATFIVPPLAGDTLTGGVTTRPAPPNCSWLVRLGGPSARGVRQGRMYLPGVRDDELNSNGDISDAQLVTYQAAASDFVDGVLAAAGAPLRVVHNPSGGSVSTTEVLGALVEKPIATQRRRLHR